MTYQIWLLSFTPTVSGVFFIEATSLTNQISSYDIVLSSSSITFTPESRNSDVVGAVQIATLSNKATLIAADFFVI